MLKCSSETRGIFIIKTVQGVDMHINYFLRTNVFCKYRNILIIWCYQADPTLTLAEAMIAHIASHPYSIPITWIVCTKSVEIFNLKLENMIKQKCMSKNSRGPRGGLLI